MASLVYSGTTAASSSAASEIDVNPHRVLSDLYGDEERAWHERQRQKEAEMVIPPLDLQKLNDALSAMNTPVKTKYAYPLQKDECAPIVQGEVVFNLARDDLLFQLVNPSDKFKSFALLRGVSAINWELSAYRHEKQYQSRESIKNLLKSVGVCYLKYPVKRSHPLLSSEKFRNFEAADIACSSTVRVFNIWLNAEHCGKTSWDQCKDPPPKDGTGLMCWLLLEKVEPPLRVVEKSVVVSSGKQMDIKTAPGVTAATTPTPIPVVKPVGSGGQSNPSAFPVFTPGASQASSSSAGGPPLPPPFTPAQQKPSSVQPKQEMDNKSHSYFRLRPVTTRHRHDPWPQSTSKTPDYLFPVGIIRDVSDSSVALKNQPDLLQRFLYPRTPNWIEFLPDLSFADITLYL